MRIVLDVETNSLINPTKIWCIVCKDIDTGEIYIFRNVTEDVLEKERFCDFWRCCKYYIGHNLLGYDLPVLTNLLGCTVEDAGRDCLDTLIISKLVDYPRSGHSIEHYGEEFVLPKGGHLDFTQWSQELEDYCIRDVNICHKIYLKYQKYIDNEKHRLCIALEHKFQLITNDLSSNGFSFNLKKAKELLKEVEEKLKVIDEDILAAFPPRLKLIREVTPKETKYGTISLTSIPKSLRADISNLSVGCSFSYCHWVSFNPSSHAQIVRVLNEAGWSPVDKTETHKDIEREIQKLKHTKRDEALDVRLEQCYARYNKLKIYGWRVNEANLETLPTSAPEPARFLAKRILLESRRRTLTEWINLVWVEIEIEHGQLIGLGIKENEILTQNGWPKKEVSVEDGNLKTLTKLEKTTEETISNIVTDYQLKTLLEWLKSKKVNVQSVKNNVNSTSIIVIGQEQLENFSAAIAIASSDGTKHGCPKYKIISERIHGRFNGIGAWSHRMNHQNPNTANIPNTVKVSDGSKVLYGKELRSLWQAPKGRLLVGVDAEAIQLRVFAHLINDPELTNAIVNGKKSEGTDPHSLNKSYFGSYCKTRNAAKHSLYAMFFGGGVGKIAEIMACTKEQAQEAIDSLIQKYPGLLRLQKEVMPIDAKRGFFEGLDGRKVRIPGDTVGARKHLCMSGYLQNGEKIIMALATVKFAPELKQYNSFLVNLVHDEWQTETPNDMEIALKVAKLQTDALEWAGGELNLNCPITGSYWNDDDQDYTIATNWSKTH